MKTITLVRVFLASPGDLREERRLAKEAVDEINQQIAPRLGYRVELMGWEDTLPGYGRPQDKINLDLDICELFLGIMWKKWGTPPSLDGEYTSGFEEEFERSYKRCSETGKPEMAMFFKEIGKDYLSDPGDDLKKVLSFRERLIENKSILFQEFTDPYEFQRRVRQKITEYLLELEQSEINDREGESARSKAHEAHVSNDSGSDYTKSPFSPEGHNFLKYLLDKTADDENSNTITSYEVARFRLLSNTITESGNDKPYFGVHDANILFINKHVDFSYQELSKLVDCGLENIKHENVPYWYWYTIFIKTATTDVFFYKTLFFDNINVCVGALEAMRLCGLVPPNKGQLNNRKFYISKWLSDTSTDEIKIAALRYLKLHGKEKDLDAIENELAKANPKTQRPSLEAILEIQFQYSKGNAIKTAFSNQFDIIDEILLNKVLSISSTLDEETLRLGLKHRNINIRLESIRRLIDRKLLKHDQLTEFNDDPSITIRKEVVYFHLNRNQPLDDSKVKQILVKPKSLAGLLQTTDEEGEEHYSQYLYTKHLKLTRRELLALTKNSIFLNLPAYFALCERYFGSQANEIREDIADCYKSKFEGHLEFLRNNKLPDDIINKHVESREHLCNRLTRKALDLLCNKNNIVDLNRIRFNMSLGIVKSSPDELAYLAKHGDWEDIHFILSADKEFVGRLFMTILPADYEWYRLKAKVIYSLGKNRFNDLLSMDIPSDVLPQLLKLSPASKFGELTETVIMDLLTNENEKVRKNTVLKLIQSLKKQNIKSLLTAYLERQEYRYYNVLVWLDFGVSMPKAIVKNAAKIALED